MAAACDFDENLFRAKLAEQTERYSGKIKYKITAVPTVLSLLEAPFIN